MGTKNRSPLFLRGLPKWPQMWVTGVPVGSEKALEVIRRTDTFFTHLYGGNQHIWNHWVRKALNMPLGELEASGTCGVGAKFNAEKWQAHWDAEETWKKAWGCIQTEYVDNSWVSCNFIFGAHGWMHPDGTIGFVDNVGKWPSVEEVYEDWRKLAKEFPFLNLGVSLMSGEESDSGIHPVVSFQVKNGKVRIVDPAKTDVHKHHLAPTRRNIADVLKSSEIGVTVEMIEGWAKRFRV